ncbi:MAG: hypothetical protein ACTSVR_08605 [Candidatus Thorarchaeota archaeon]
MPNIAEQLSWKHASIIMVLATVVPPYSTALFGIFGDDYHVSISTYALLWVIYPSEAGVSGLQVLNYYALYSGLSLGFFNIVFAFQVIRFIRGTASKRNTLFAGVLTLFIPTLFFIAAGSAMLSARVFTYIGPVPIQLATGFLLMRFAGPKEITTPW